jgi:hypothetical protein
MTELFCKWYLWVLLAGVGGLLPLRVQGGHLQACHVEYRDLGRMMLELRVMTYSDPAVAFVDRCADGGLAVKCKWAFGEAPSQTARFTGQAPSRHGRAG